MAISLILFAYSIEASISLLIIYFATKDDKKVSPAPDKSFIGTSLPG